MANTQAAFGFKHIGYQGGSAPDFQYSTRAILKSSATVIGFGDPVQRTNNTSPYITLAAGGSVTTGPLEGIFYGCQITPAGGGAPTWSPGWPGVTAASDAVAYIIDAPNALFLAATLLTACSSGIIGQTIGVNIGTASTTGAMLSGATIDQSTATATVLGTTMTAWPFRLISLFGPGQGNFGAVGNGTDQTSNYAWVVVGFNNQVNRTLGGW